LGEPLFEMSYRFLPPELRKKVEGLLSQMTIDEKIAQLASVDIRELLTDGELDMDKVRRHLSKGIGEITRPIGTGAVLEASRAVEYLNRIQRFLIEETRLGIPALPHEECLSGAMIMGSTIYPQAINLASTWNPQLVEEMTGRIREVLRTVGARQALSPVADVQRDPRWGRTEETFGEDPYLVASMTCAYVKGLQGERLRKGIAATLKHFAAYGFSEGGRNIASVHVGLRELREVFLYPFEAGVKVAGAVSVMNAYHEIDGVPCGASKFLLRKILREEWGFQGYVVSDYSTFRLLCRHGVASDLMEAAAVGLKAGITIELPRSDSYGEPLKRAVEKGLVSESLIDEAVRSVLTWKYLLGVFDEPYGNPRKVKKVLDPPRNRKLARELARESIILLKNNGVLPLDKSLKVAVIGPHSNSTKILGDYAYPQHVRCEKVEPKIVTVLEGIIRKVGRNRVRFAKGCDYYSKSRNGFADAVKAAEDCDVVVVVVGEVSGFHSETSCGEGRDRVSLRLPGVQEEVVKTICEVGKPVILIHIGGRPMELGWMEKRRDAILEAWLPGEEGGNAIADILFGDYNPSGKLPISYPKTVGQIPVYYMRKPASIGKYVFEDSEPLYPFGYGLSYTKFKLSNLRINPKRVPPVGYADISVEIENVGDMEGAETVQLYINDPVASVSRPIKELKGFAKVLLKPGESKSITFRLFMEQLAFYDPDMQLVVEPGVYNVMIGTSSRDIKLRGRFRVVGETAKIDQRRIFFSKVTVE